MDKQAPLFLYQPWREHKPGNEKRDQDKLTKLKSPLPLFSEWAHTPVEST